MQDALSAQLEIEGWDVREAADTESKAPGIDLLATKANRWLAIEVKGYPNTTYDHGPKRGQPKPTQPAAQARQWFSHALLGMMLLRDKRPDAEIAICFPRFGTYEKLVRRTTVSFDLLGFGVYFVSDSGAVTLALPHRAVAGAPDLSSDPIAGTESPPPPRVAGVGDGNCRDEILAAFRRLELREQRTVFAPVEVVQEVLAVTERFPARTIRTEITSRICADAPTHHATTYNDLERVGRGRYRVRIDT